MKKQIGSTVAPLGFVAVLVCCVWGLSFYSNVADFVGANNADRAELFKCIVHDSPPCTLVKGVAKVAGYTTYEPIFLWVSASVLLLGLLTISFSFDGTTSRETSDEMPGPHYSNSFAMPLGHKETFDRARWNALLKYDDDIAKVATRLSVLGERWVDEFASSFLTLNDKSYLPDIVRKIMAAARAEYEESEQRALAERQKQEAIRQEAVRQARMRKERVDYLVRFFLGTGLRKLIVAATLVVALVGPPAFFWLREYFREHLDMNLSYDGKSKATLRYKSLVVILNNEPGQGGRPVPVSTGIYRGRQAFSVRFDDEDGGGLDVEVRVLPLDLASSMPQVIFTHETGGNHCCTQTRIATMDRSGDWQVVRGDPLSGFGYLFEDIDGNGDREMVQVDDRFPLAFDCYACSYAPIQIRKLVGIDLRNVTNDSKYQGYLRDYLNDMEASGRSANVLRTNGYLGGWVAAKFQLGEGEDAWRVMLSSYERNSQWDMTECLVDALPYMCPADKKRQMSFPEALAKHLVGHGYATQEVMAALTGKQTEQATQPPVSTGPAALPASAPQRMGQNKQSSAAVAAALRAAATPGTDLILRRSAIVGDYAIQSWVSDPAGGEAILKFDRAKGQWVVLDWGGGAWDVNGLVQFGLPRETASALLARVPITGMTR